MTPVSENLVHDENTGQSLRNCQKNAGFDVLRSKIVKTGGYQTHNFVHFAYLLGIWGRSENILEEVFFTVFLIKN